MMPSRTTAATPLSPRIPAALQRLSSPNASCKALYDETHAWEAYCAGMPEFDITKSPYAGMVPGGREIQRFASLPIGSVPADGSNNIVLTETAPSGYDGIIGRVVNFFTGTGFIEGSGGIAWRVQVGNHYARNLGNILFTYGSLLEPFEVPGIGIPIVSGQTLTYQVSVPVGSPISGSNATFICGIFGFYTPRK